MAIATKYANKYKLALATVSRQFHGSQAFLTAFRKGEVTVTLTTLKKMVAGFDEKWPADVPWPAVTVLHRPAPRRKARASVEKNP